MIRLGGPDIRSIGVLDDWPQGLCVADGLSTKDPKIRHYLVETYFSNGAALFGRESPYEISQFRKQTGKTLDQLDDRQVYFIIQYFVQRVRNYGHVESMFIAEMETARVSSERDECSGKHGRLISVFQMKHFVDWCRTLTAEQYFEKVYGRDRGYPPFTLSCSCRLEGLFPGVEY